MVYLAANVRLASTNTFASLMVFRGIQALGSAAIISLSQSLYNELISRPLTSS